MNREGKGRHSHWRGCRGDLRRRAVIGAAAGDGERAAIADAAARTLLLELARAAAVRAIGFAAAADLCAVGEGWAAWRRSKGRGRAAKGRCAMEGWTAGLCYRCCCCWSPTMVEEAPWGSSAEDEVGLGCTCYRLGGGGSAGHCCAQPARERWPEGDGSVGLEELELQWIRREEAAAKGRGCQGIQPGYNCCAGLLLLRLLVERGGLVCKWRRSGWGIQGCAGACAAVADEVGGCVCAQPG